MDALMSFIVLKEKGEEMFLVLPSVRVFKVLKEKERHIYGYIQL